MAEADYSQRDCKAEVDERGRDKMAPQSPSPVPELRTVVGFLSFSFYSLGAHHQAPN